MPSKSERERTVKTECGSPQVRSDTFHGTPKNALHQSEPAFYAGIF